ncbi:thiolase C-terminal domain-containing protein [Pseudomonas nicosulfuronedens]
MNRRVNVIGVGMPPFALPAAGADSMLLASEAIRLALADAGIGYNRVEAVYCGVVGGAPGCAQTACAPLGLSGIPQFNLDNGGASGASALVLARQAVEQGAVECALVLGLEPSSAEAATAEILRGNRLFADAAGEYLARHGARRESLAMVTVKAREHAANNPQALFRQRMLLEQVLAEKPLFEPLSASQCALPAVGAAAVLLCSDAFARKHASGLRIQLLAQAQSSDLPAGPAGDTALRAAGFDQAVAAVRQVYERAGVGPGEIDLCELHDATSFSEILLYEALGFCREGDAERLIEDGDNTYGGNQVMNPSGGILGRGHPLGASALAQCIELVLQLRGTAGARQVPNARHALQHSQSLCGATVVSLYRRD